VSLRIVETEEEPLVSAPVAAAVRQGLSSGGSAVLLVPSFAAALDAQRCFAASGIGMGVACTTPSAWVGERWEVWGDGRRIVGDAARHMMVRDVLEQAAGLEVNPGTVELLCQLVRAALPWLQVPGELDRLTPSERRLIACAQSYACELHEHDMLEECEADLSIAPLLKKAGVSMPSMVFAGFDALSRGQRELACSLASCTQVIFCCQLTGGAAAQTARQLLRELRASAAAAGVWQPSPAQGARGGVRAAASPASRLHAPRRAPELEELRRSLFVGHDADSISPTGAVGVVLPAGPLAEGRAVAQTVVRATTGEDDVVIAVADVARAWRELPRKLVLCGRDVELQADVAFESLESGRSFLEYVQEVARLADLAASWPTEEEAGGAVKVYQGRMSWWPPRELTDFLLSAIAHVPAWRAHRLDASWRANRLLTPATVLTDLMTEKKTSVSVARATRELLRGRVASAAAKLLSPFTSSKQTAAAAQPAQDGVPQEDAPVGAQLFAAEAKASFSQVFAVAQDLKEIGVTADAETTGAMPFAAFAAVFTEVMRQASVPLRIRTQSCGGRPVRLMELRAAARLAPRSADVVIACGLTSEEDPIPRDVNLAEELLDRMGIEPAPDPLMQARTRFSHLVAVPRRRLVLERSLKNAASEDAYSSVMLTELLARYGIEGENDSTKFERAVRKVFGSDRSPEWTEVEVDRNVSASGEPSREVGREIPAPTGVIDPELRGLVIVPPEGVGLEQDRRPLLSASQIETYLACPYKWFSLRRLRLSDADALFSGAEMGTFAHRVLEVVHAQLFEEGADIHAPAGLQRAHELLDSEFAEHLSHQYIPINASRTQPQALIVHNTQQEGRLNALKEDLASFLDYESALFAGFVPTLFEWDFGRGDDVVEYAGARLVGTVDRVDVDEHGLAVVIDYKHRSVAGFAREYDVFDKGGHAPGEDLALPHRVQSLIYGQVIRRAHPDVKVVAALYLCTRGAHELAGAVDANLVDRVFGSLPISSQRIARLCVEPDDTFGSDTFGSDGAAEGQEASCGMAGLLDACEEAIAARIERMRAGCIEANPINADACKWCPVLNCEKRLAR
jgi:ATP-dependent helicase/nuclease subunit B